MRTASQPQKKPRSPKPKNPRSRRAGNYLADTRVHKGMEWDQGEKARKVCDTGVRLNPFSRMFAGWSELRRRAQKKICVLEDTGM